MEEAVAVAPQLAATDTESGHPTPAQPAGWEAELSLRYAPSGGATRIVERSRRGPLAVQRPFYPEGEVCHTYLLHPPGGVVGGDSLDIRIAVETGASALITTPGATKFYRSGRRLATQTQLLRVDAGATLEWLPQENIFFPSTTAKVCTRIELASGARFIGWDIQCLGRPVIDEVFNDGAVDCRTELYRDGELLLSDRLHTEGRRLVDAAAGLRGFPMQATLLIAPGEGALLDLVRQQLPVNDSQLEAGATLIDGILVVRLIGRRTEAMMRCLCAVWRAVRPALLARPACPPRIWST